MPKPTFTKAAQENIDETSTDWERDLRELSAGIVTPQQMLERCLYGADADRHAGWRDYVAALVEATH